PLNGTFTQQDLLDAKVRYLHDAGESPSDGFGFTVADAAGSSSAGTFALTIKPQNDPPQVVTAGPVTVDEDVTVVLDETLLLATDAESAPDKVRYKLTARPQFGRLKLNTTILVLNATFTQADVAA